MNKNYLPNETSQQHRERLKREMSEEVEGHQRAVLTALLGLGHNVKPPESWNAHFGLDWVVDGHHIHVTVRYETRGYCYEPTGGVRFIVGPYNHKKTFIKKTSEKELKKNPSGFDYVLIAQTMVNIINEELERHRQEEGAQKRAEENDKSARTAIQRLTAEFDLQSSFGLVPHPIVCNRGHKELGLEFRDLTEAQVRTILTAAKACGALE